MSTVATPRRKLRHLSALIAASAVVALAGTATTAPGGAAPAAAAAGSNPLVVMPTAAPAGWTRLHSQGFDTPVTTGGFVNAPDANDWFLSPSNPYAKQLRSYPDGWATTGGNSLNYASKTAGVNSSSWGTPGVFEVYAHTENIGGVPKSLAGSFFPVIKPTAATNDAQVSQTYGRYTVRFRTVGGGAPDPAHPEASSGYGTAFLLWPADNKWNEGEVDFPEMSWGSDIKGFVHTKNNPSVNAHVINTTTTTDSDWHTATLEWYPTALVFYVDGVQVSKVTDNVPTTPFRWGFQSGGHDGTPAASTNGKLWIDWYTVDSYNGAKVPS